MLDETPFCWGNRGRQATIEVGRVIIRCRIRFRWRLQSALMRVKCYRHAEIATEINFSDIFSATTLTSLFWIIFGSHMFREPAHKMWCHFRANRAACRNQRDHWHWEWHFTSIFRMLFDPDFYRSEIFCSHVRCVRLVETSSRSLAADKILLFMFRTHSAIPPNNKE